MPNSIARMQVINGGCTAVLVMPTGDGGNRCCDDGAPALFSLGAVDLKHGVNNLYPAIRPYPDWRAFVDGNDAPPQPAAEEQQQQTDDRSRPPNKRIVNAVDAFLDDRGRLLWVLDTGDGGEDACYGADRRNGSSAPDADAEDLQPPKFMAIDVQTDQVNGHGALSVGVVVATAQGPPAHGGHRPGRLTLSLPPVSRLRRRAPIDVRS